MDVLHLFFFTHFTYNFILFLLFLSWFCGDCLNSSCASLTALLISFCWSSLSSSKTFKWYWVAHMVWWAPHPYLQPMVVFWAPDECIQQPTRNQHLNVAVVIQNQFYLSLNMKPLIFPTNENGSIEFLMNSRQSWSNFSNQIKKIVLDHIQCLKYPKSLSPCWYK